MTKEIMLAIICIAWIIKRAIDLNHDLDIELIFIDTPWGWMWEECKPLAWIIDGIWRILYKVFMCAWWPVVFCGIIWIIFF